MMRVYLKELKNLNVKHNFDILTLSEKDMETLKFNEENKSLKLAREDKEMKSFVEDIHRKDKKKKIE